MPTLPTFEETVPYEEEEEVVTYENTLPVEDDLPSIEDTVPVQEELSRADKVAQYIADKEAFKAYAYYDGKRQDPNDPTKDIDRYSIGYGTLADKGEVISETEARRRMKEFIEKQRAEWSNESTSNLTLGEEKALSSFFYHLGLGEENKIRQTLLGFINSGQREKAADYMAQFNKAFDKDGNLLDDLTQGLTNRRQSEIETLFEDYEEMLDPPDIEDTEPVTETRPSFDETEPVTEEESEFTAEKAAKSYMEGASGGYYDEVRAAVESGTWFSGREYIERRNAIRQEMKQIREDHPVGYWTSTVAGGVTTMFIPGFNYANTLRGAKLIGAAAIEGAAFGYGFSESEKGTEIAQDILIGAGFGAAGGGLSAGINKFFGKRQSVINKHTEGKPHMKDVLAARDADDIAQGVPQSESLLQVIEEFLPDEHFARIKINAQKMIGRVNKKTSQVDMWLQIMRNDDINKLSLQTKRFVNSIALQDPFKKVTPRAFADARRTLEHHGWKGLQKYFDEFNYATALRKAANQEADKVARMSDPLADSTWLNILRPSAWQADHVDKPTGLNFRGLFSKFGRAHNTVNNDAVPFLAARDMLEKKRRKLGISDERLVALLENPAASLKGEEAAMLSQYKTFFNTFGKMMDEKHGVAFNPINFYFPHSQINKIDTGLKLRELAVKVDAGTATKREYKDLVRSLKFISDPEARTVYTLAEVRKGTAVAKTEEAVKAYVSPGSKTTPSPIVQGMKIERKPEGIPSILIERDPNTAIANYIYNNLSAAVYNKPLREFASELSALRGLGKPFEKSVEYFETTLSQLSGNPRMRTSMAAMTQIRIKEAGRKIMKYEGLPPFIRTPLGKTIDLVPDIMSWLSSQHYAQNMGWSIHLPLRNSAQTLTRTMPEIGGEYGMDVTFRGFGKARETFAKDRNFSRLDARSHRSKEDVNEYISHISKELAGSVPVRMTEWVAKMGMKFYKFSDHGNRFLTMHIGEEIASDLIKGNVKAAKQVLVNMSPGTRTELYMAMKRNDTGDVKRIMVDYLLDKTQYSYAPAALSNFAREWGGMFAAYTRWPAEIISDVFWMTQNKGVMAPMRKYGALTAIMTGLEISRQNLSEIDNDKLSVIIGHDLKTWSPGSSVWGLGPTPFLQFVASSKKTLEHALEMEGKAAWSEFQRGAKPFVPMSALHKAYGKGEKLLK